MDFWVWFIAHLLLLLLMFGALVSAGSIGLNVALATAAHKGDVFAVQTGEWITSVYALTLATNLSSTSAY